MPEALIGRVARTAQADVIAAGSIIS